MKTLAYLTIFGLGAVCGYLLVQHLKAKPTSDVQKTPAKAGGGFYFNNAQIEFYRKGTAN